MSDSLYAIQILGNGTFGDPYRVASAFEVDDDEIEAEDDFSKSEYAVSFEGVLNTPEFKIIVTEPYPNGVEIKVYQPVPSGASVSIGNSQLPLFYRADERFVSSGGVPLSNKFEGIGGGDDVYAIQIDGSGAGNDPYRVAAAFEVDDDEIEAEDDFSKSEYIVSFEGKLNTPEFEILVKEAYPNGVEVKIYRPIFSGANPSLISIGVNQLPLYYKAEEQFLPGPGGVFVDDKYEGSREIEDNFHGSDRDDLFDLRGVKGNKNGGYWDRASGGLGNDDYVLGKSFKSSYYDDKSKRRETYLYADEFRVGDRFRFLRESSSYSGYKLVTVAGSKYQARLERFGGSEFAGADAVLVNSKDSGDILACINFDGPAPKGGWTTADLF